MESRFGTKEEKQVKMLWNNFKVAFAMYSKIPPCQELKLEQGEYEIYLLLLSLYRSCDRGFVLAVGWAGEADLGFQAAFVAAVLVLVPVWVTGGIHVDGLLDTSDALSSWQERRRLEILKGFPCWGICCDHGLCLLSCLVWCLQPAVALQTCT